MKDRIEYFFTELENLYFSSKASNLKTVSMFQSKFPKGNFLLARDITRKCSNALKKVEKAFNRKLIGWSKWNLKWKHSPP